MGQEKTCRDKRRREGKGRYLLHYSREPEVVGPKQGGSRGKGEWKGDRGFTSVRGWESYKIESYRLDMIHNPIPLYLVVRNNSILTDFYKWKVYSMKFGFI